MSLVLSFHYLLLNKFRMLVHPSSGSFDLLWIYFMCCIGLVRWVGATVWFGWGGVVSLCRLKQCCFCSRHTLLHYRGNKRYTGWRLGALLSLASRCDDSHCVEEQYPRLLRAALAWRAAASGIVCRVYPNAIETCLSHVNVGTTDCIAALCVVNYLQSWFVSAVLVEHFQWKFHVTSVHWYRYFIF